MTATGIEYRRAMNGRTLRILGSKHLEAAASLILGASLEGNECPSFSHCRGENLDVDRLENIVVGRAVRLPSRIESEDLEDMAMLGIRSSRFDRRARESAHVPSCDASVSIEDDQLFNIILANRL